MCTGYSLLAPGSTLVKKLSKGSLDEVIPLPTNIKKTRRPGYVTALHPGYVTFSDNYF